MSHPITTSGLTGPDTTTYHQSGQNTSDWVDTHNGAVDARVPDGNKLTTTWTSAAGAEEVTTTRQLGENDDHFLARHELAYCLAMIDAAPVT